MIYHLSLSKKGNMKQKKFQPEVMAYANQLGKPMTAEKAERINAELWQKFKKLKEWCESEEDEEKMLKSEVNSKEDYQMLGKLLARKEVIKILDL